MNKKHIAKLRSVFSRLKRTKIDYELNEEIVDHKTLFKFTLDEVRTKNLADILNLFKLHYLPIELGYYWQRKVDDFFNSFQKMYCNVISLKDKLTLTPNIKYVTEIHLLTEENEGRVNRTSIPALILPKMILEPPLETIVNGTTYRVITGDDKIDFIASHMDKIYDYLDQYHFYNTYYYDEKNKTSGKYAVSTLFTYETLLIFILCSLSSKFPDMLDNGFFIDPKKTSLYRLKMEKSLSKENREIWKQWLVLLEKEYKSNAVIAFAQKLASGEVEYAEFHNIKFTPNTASYQNVEVRHTDLFKKFMENTSVINEFHIYDVVRSVAKEQAKLLDELGTIEQTKEVVVKREYDEVTKDKVNRVVDPTQFTDGLITLDTFYINNIPLILTKEEKNGYRRINGIRINSNEVEEVLYRCSCFQNEEDYTNFLKQTSALNLKCTDAISAGLGLKIDKDYAGKWEDPIPHAESSKLYFKIIDKKVHLIIDDTERTCPVKLNYLVKQTEIINRRASGKDAKTTKRGWGNRYYYEPKQADFARKLLRPALKKATTFTFKRKVEKLVEIITPPIENIEVPVMITDQGTIEPLPFVTDISIQSETTTEVTPLVTQEIKPIEEIVKDITTVVPTAQEITPIVESKEITTTVIEEEVISYLTDKDLDILLGYVDKRHENAIEKSKEFLEMALKSTGATEERYNGRTHYKVKGNLREYYVDKENCKVYEAKTGGYVCIVNDSHAQGVGYDDLATRLLALHNDSYLVNDITTLKVYETVEPETDKTVPELEDETEEDEADLVAA
jgi:hypothetical protein